MTYQTFGFIIEYRDLTHYVKIIFYVYCNLVFKIEMYPFIINASRKYGVVLYKCNLNGAKIPTVNKHRLCLILLLFTYFRFETNRPTVGNSLRAFVLFFYFGKTKTKILKLKLNVDYYFSKLSKCFLFCIMNTTL